MDNTDFFFVVSKKTTRRVIYVVSVVSNRTIRGVIYVVFMLKTDNLKKKQIKNKISKLFYNYKFEDEDFWTCAQGSK